MVVYRMPHSGHKKHLCYLANLYFPQSQPKEYQKLVSNPKYFCKKCGRAAADQRNLCNPAKMR